jgi:hypothetical protein
MQAMIKPQSLSFETPRLFDSRDSRPTVLKLGFPLALWLPLVFEFHQPQKPGGIVLLGLVTALGLFFFTLALIMPSDHHVQYKRYIRWHKIDYNEILACKQSIIPLVGYVKLKRFVPPWGKLYFVFYTPSAPFLGGSERKMMIQYVQDKMAGRDAAVGVEARIATNTVEMEEKGSAAKCGLWALMGLIWALFLRLYLGLRIATSPPPAAANENVLYQLAVSLWKFGAYLLDWPYNAVVVVAILALIVAWRYRRKAWGAAAALGFFLGEVLARVLHRLL